MACCSSWAVVTPGGPGPESHGGADAERMMKYFVVKCGEMVVSKQMTKLNACSAHWHHDSAHLQTRVHY